MLTILAQRLLLMVALLSSASGAGLAAEPNIARETQGAFAAILAHPQVKHGLGFLKSDDANTLPSSVRNGTS